MEEPTPLLLKALQNYNENLPRDRIRWASSTNALKWLVPKTVATEPFQSLPRETHQARGDRSSLSIQMFIARLTKNQDKFLVRIRPHLSARKAWKRHSTIWLAYRDHHSKYWRTSHRWDQTCARYSRATTTATTTAARTSPLHLRWHEVCTGVLRHILPARCRNSPNREWTKAHTQGKSEL